MLAKKKKFLESNKTHRSKPLPPASMPMRFSNNKTQIKKDIKASIQKDLKIRLKKSILIKIAISKLKKNLTEKTS